MKRLLTLLPCFLIITAGLDCSYAHSHTKKLSTLRPNDNQTATLSPVLPGSQLPFQVVIETANFQLPVGFHSGVVGVYKGLWVFIAGRINGLHGFDATNNFPADQQNSSIYVVNPSTGQVFSRSLSDPGSGLSQKQIDSLTVTSPQFYQEDNTLIMSGGYGVDTATGTFGTKLALTAIYLPGIVDWVTQPASKDNSVIKNIKQVYHPTFQVTGGSMYKLGNVTQLVFGQNFTGEYTDGSNGDYSEQVRRFQIHNTPGQFSVDVLNSMPSNRNPNYRRRDLNILPALLNKNGHLEYGLVAYAGVFTETGGVWTVPVIINGNDDPMMADPASPNTFKQAMNQYVCASASFYSRRNTSMYHIFFGGISYGYFSGGTFQTDSEIPFINQVTTIKMDTNRNFSQYLMDNQYPVIASTGSNPGNTLIFGAGAYFMANNISQYANGVINLDNIRKPTVIGYIVGGIQSTLPNTNTKSDSSASPYVFKVTLIPMSHVTRGTAAKSTKSLSVDHAGQSAQLAFLHGAHSSHKYNHKYHVSSSRQARQSHHPA